MNIEAALNPKKNSLIFIKLMLAVSVIFSHSYVLGGFGLDPLHKPFKASFGSLALESFFVISGFLVTASFFRNASLLKYLRNRFFRIFPGFWASLLFSGLILAPIAYIFENKEFPAIQTFFSYVITNAFLLINQQTINGIFIHNPLPLVVNGSLWSLFPEFLCYIAIPLASLLSLLNKQKKTLFVLFLAYLIFNGIEGARYGYFENSSTLSFFRILFEFQRYSAYFFAGSLFFIFAAKKVFSSILFYAFLIAVLISIVFQVYNFIGPILLPYVIIGLAIKLPFPNFSKIGDYSYGLYIYAFPVQQTVYLLNPNIKSPMFFFFISIIFTLPLAFLSWHFIELPVLRLKDGR